MMTTSHQLLALLAAAALGGLIGLERELNAQKAGFRTHVLVALGSALFTTVGADVVGSDPTRVAAQVVTGIVWVTSGSGVACGLGRAGLGAFAVGVGLVALVGFKLLERDVFPRRRGHDVVLEVTETADVMDVVAQASRVLGAAATVRRVERGLSDRTILTLSSPLVRGYSLLDLTMRLKALDSVVGVDLDS